MGRLARKKQHKGNNVLKQFKTKRYRRDVDEISKDLEPANREKLLNQKLDLDVAGGAQHYCITCAKHFLDEKTLQTHFKSKPHKRRMKKLETEPYSQEEAERAAGMGSYVAPKKLRTVEEMKKLITKDKPESMETSEENKEQDEKS
ncbi:zinc finger protein 593-like [Tubulanus polymorphus]|uniref:zinc finger protein 593-like n=1 Tax=Tubulanus polymorphus TaxID=672921 RepID=UPI003DA41916